MKGVDSLKALVAVKFWSDKKIKPLLKKLGYRWYEIQDDVKVSVLLDTGLVLDYYIKKGFRFDSRSGGFLVDLVLPHFGSEMYIMCWLIHDVNAYAQYYSFRDTNELLYSMLHLAGANALQRKAVRAVGVNDFWFGEPKYGDREYPNLYPEAKFELKYRGWQ